jgi:hypothetical protein
VEVGLKDDTYAEIKSGLQQGEVVTTGLTATNQNAGTANRGQ